MIGYAPCEYDVSVWDDHIDATFEVRDRNGLSRIDFSFSDEPGRVLALQKVKRLRGALERFGVELLNTAIPFGRYE